MCQISNPHYHLPSPTTDPNYSWNGSVTSSTDPSNRTISRSTRSSRSRFISSTWPLPSLLAGVPLPGFLSCTPLPKKKLRPLGALACPSYELNQVTEVQGSKQKNNRGRHNTAHNTHRHESHSTSHPISVHSQPQVPPPPSLTSTASIVDAVSSERGTAAATVAPLGGGSKTLGAAYMNTTAAKPNAKKSNAAATKKVTPGSSLCRVCWGVGVGGGRGEYSGPIGATDATSTRAYGYVMYTHRLQGSTLVHVNKDMRALGGRYTHASRVNVPVTHAPSRRMRPGLNMCLKILPKRGEPIACRWLVCCGMGTRLTTPPRPHLQTSGHPHPPSPAPVGS